MLRLSADQSALATEYGLYPQQSLLFSAIRRDSHPLVSPLIASHDGSDPVLLVRQQEQGNVLSAGVPAERIRFYAPWVTLDPRPVADVEVASSLTALVSDLSDDGAVTLAADVVYAHQLALSTTLSVTTEKAASQPVRVRRIPVAEIVDRFVGWRRHGAEVATKLISGIEHLKGLEAEFGAPDTRFARLGTIAAENRLDAMLVTAPPNFSEITGRASTEQAFALWIPGAEHVLIITPADADADHHGTPVGEHSSLGEAVAELALGPRVGVEEEFISVGTAREFTDRGLELVPSSMELGHWRDVRDNEDLPFQVIAARASVHAIEDALEWASKEIESGAEFTERDIYARYLEFLAKFLSDKEIPFEVKPYFTNLHSSNRMLFPGPPVDYPISDETTCIQLDAGVAVSVDGVVVATSDMARSLPRTAAAMEAYEFFFTVVREGIIGQLRPGVVCEDVHEGTMRFLAPHLRRMIEIGMLGEHTDFDTIYRRRNVGHLMGKQESFANELRPGYKHALDIGSFGAAEIPWRYNDAAIGTEDLWYIGADRTYILSQR
ncbi:aminopeptidase P family N-terminal domain-containing protein [Rhodococcus sp. AQ5-07]|uniref:aminopeptidase P family N-terminal domain-containing protein n=1 Tax=Rhodococcus sp. AQ5-07 TaxID=2054902 RepID=UPI000DBF78EB|nr:aminopeptidase P family N-terminal domain-containing protein [Rhodococcus sp. AQ5-07]RAL31594.1 Xaa-Pro aminopeptidase [Rhodococcus sp. AQ5-07]